MTNDMTFEQYWEYNLENYKFQAMKDFDRLQNGKFEARVSINTDDDFALDIEYDFSMYAMTREELESKLIEKLNSANVINGKSWSITYDDGTSKSGNQGDIWNYIRDQAIREIQDEYGSNYISVGGNQTIEIDISKINPDFK